MRIVNLKLKHGCIIKQLIFYLVWFQRQKAKLLLTKMEVEGTQ